MKPLKVIPIWNNFYRFSREKKGKRKRSENIHKLEKKKELLKSRGGGGGGGGGGKETLKNS